MKRCDFVKAGLLKLAGLAVPAGATRAPAHEVYSGSTFFIGPVRTRKAGDAAVLDRATVEAVFAAAGVGSLIFQQGVFAKRPSRLHVRASMAATEVTGVKFGGISVVVGEGAMAV